MAIRNDFAPGEVLAAADLLDTFGSKVDYPSGGADGDALIKSGTSAAWGAAGGLTLVTSESFSTASAVNINGCFSSAYDNYRILIETTCSTDTGFTVRLRASGTDNTASEYVRQRIVASNTSITGERTSTTVWFWSSMNTERNAISADIFSPHIARNTTYVLHALYGSNRADTHISNGTHNVASSFDGISLIAQSGNMTGTVRIYGYRN